MKRSWRVGTFSMGISLLFLGVFLLLSQFLQWEITTALKIWWPVILVVLGIEILLYLFTSKQEKPYLSFDLFSIILVGIIGTAGIAVVFLQSTGLIAIVEDSINREEVTKTLPTFDYEIGDNIKRIVVESDGQSSPLTIEGTSEDAVSIFGSYRVIDSSENILSAADDYIQVTNKGDTLYLSMMQLPSKVTEFYSDYSVVDATLLIPTDVKLEVAGINNDLTLNPRNLESDWSINNASYVTLQLAETKNVKVSVRETEIVDKDLGSWKSTDQTETEEGEVVDTLWNASLTKGKEEATISVSNSGSMDLTGNY